MVTGLAGLMLLGWVAVVLASFAIPFWIWSMARSLKRIASALERGAHGGDTPGRGGIIGLS